MDTKKGHSTGRRDFIKTIASASVLAAIPAGLTKTSSGKKVFAGISDKPFRGIFTIAATPFKESKEIDFEDLAGQIDWLNRCGVHGIVWPQYASEFKMIRNDERKHCFKVITDAAKKFNVKSAIVLGVQGDDLDEALGYVEAAKQCSPDALIAMPPVKAATLDDYRAYYYALAKEVGYPVFIQTSGGAKFDIPVEFIVSLAEEYPNLGYVKDEKKPILLRTKQLCKKKPPLHRIFSGLAGKGMLAEMSMGSDGTMPGAPYTDVYVQIWNAWQNGEKDKAREIFTYLMPLINMDSLDGQGYQYMMHYRGVFKTPVSRKERREYLPEIKAETHAAFDKLKPYLTV